MKFVSVNERWRMEGGKKDRGIQEQREIMEGNEGEKKKRDEAS